MLAVGDCSGSACPIPGGALSDAASPAANAFMLAAFASLILPNIYTGIRYRTILHTVLLLAALTMEVVGHVCKIFLTMNPTNRAYATVYLLGTHWGAILVGSAVYTVLPHEMVLYGHEFCTVGDPVYLNITFCVFDIFALVFQSVGIGFSSNSRTDFEVCFAFPF